MHNVVLRLTSIALCVLTLTFAGCGTTSQTTEDEVEPTASDDSTELAPLATQSIETMDERVARLYNFEAQIMATKWAWQKGALLDQAMAEVSALLDEEPALVDDPDFREVYRGLAAEYRKYHDYAPNDTLETARGDIFAVRAELFRELEHVNEPLLEDVVEPREKPETEIPLTDNRYVRQSIAFLQEEPENHFAQWQKRAGTYFPMIEYILEEEGVPEELKYLTMVESGLNPRARSWAGAVGMWQFMSHTGRSYGMRVNAWVDERRDPEKATRAAARHLRDLHNRFDDWHLALAAFNCGAGCVSRAIRGSGEEDPSYWDIYHSLPRETRGYVPMFIATTLVASNPDAYDMPDVEQDQAYAYDYVAVRGSMLSLDEIAEMADTSPSMIRALNPELRRNTLPPSEGHYYLRIPLGSYQQFASGYAELPDEKKRPATTYTVRSGDTISELADRYGTSTRRLRQMNGLGGSMIRVGQQLTVPADSYENALSENSSDAEPMRVQYEASLPIQSLQPMIASEDEEAASSPFQTASYDGPSPDDEDTEALAEQIGEAVEEAAGAEDEAPEPEDEEPAAEDRTETYRVQQGDTIDRIAKQYGVSVRDVMRWNGLSNSRIMPGQRLEIRPSDSDSEESGPRVHVVQSGQNLSTIAQVHGVTVQQLRDWNDLSSDRLQPGQRLVVSP